MLPVSFAISVLRGLRRTLEEVTGAIDSTEAGSTVEEEGPVHKLAGESGHVAYGEITGFPLDRSHPGGVDVMRKLQVYHESPGELSGRVWIESHRDRMGLHEQAQETKRVSELKPEDASSTFAATPPLERVKIMLSRCMTGKRQTSAEERVLGFYDISREHFHSPARRTIVIMLRKEDDDCVSGYAVLDNAMYGSKDAAQCFDVASKNAVTAMGYLHPNCFMVLTCYVSPVPRKESSL